MSRAFAHLLITAAKTLVTGVISAYERSRDVFKTARGLCIDRSHSIKSSSKLSPDKGSGHLYMTIGIRAVKRELSTSFIPDASNASTNAAMDSAPAPSLVTIVVPLGKCRHMSKSDFGEPKPFADDPNISTWVPGGNAPQSWTCLSVRSRMSSL